MFDKYQILLSLKNFYWYYSTNNDKQKTTCWTNIMNETFILSKYLRQIERIDDYLKNQLNKSIHDDYRFSIWSELFVK
jgi:hypothetical protein